MSENAAAERPSKIAMLRGYRKICPSCGKGRLFAGYLKVTDHCTVCQEEFHHHRADDGPAYLTILIVAHILGFAMHIMWDQFRPAPMVMASVLTVFSVALSLYLLPRIKGLIVSVQWAHRMHGFGNTKQDEG